jgi:hypothetical protein
MNVVTEMRPTHSPSPRELNFAAIRGFIRGRSVNSTEGSKRPINVMVAALTLSGISAMGGHDSGLTLSCGVVIVVTVGLLWRLGQPPALLMAAAVQLSQVVTPLFYANALGVPIQAVSIHVGDLTSATWFALVALGGLVVGLWCSQLGVSTESAGRMQSEAQSWSPQSAFLICVATILLAGFLEGLGGMFDGLQQPCLAASQIQWLGIFLLTCVCCIQRRGFGYLLLVTGLEIVKGMTGFFSDFRLVFFPLLVGMFAVPPPLRASRLTIGILLGIVVVALGAFWSAIKMEYRTYLSQGSREQVVLVPIEDRLAFLTDKIFEIDSETMGSGLDQLLKRWGYLDFLAATMRNVPSRLPFQNGAQIGETVAHVLQPRFFFPDKPALRSDTEVLAKYTGIYFGRSSSVGTSVSLGYVAELYVDFGPAGAVLGMVILGLLFGYSYRFVVSSTSLPAIVTFGLGVMLAMSMTSFEVSLVKMVGAFVTTVAVVLMLKVFLLAPLLNILVPNYRSKFVRQMAA